MIQFRSPVHGPEPDAPVSYGISPNSATVGVNSASALSSDLWEPRFAQQRQAMVNHQLVARGITDPRILYAMATIPRHRFVPSGEQRWAYQDMPLPIGYDQTISQPYIVAFMTDQAAILPSARVLEIGSGSGYQTAVLASLAGRVYSIEIVPPLAQQAQVTLRQLGYDNVQLKHGNGYQGWPEYAPYDAILVTAAPPDVPNSLVEQLAVGGRLVLPVGSRSQTILVITKTPTGLQTDYTIPVRFVPMTGTVGNRANRWNRDYRHSVSG